MSTDSQDEIDTTINNALRWAQKMGFDFVIGDLVEAYDGDFPAAIRAALRFIVGHPLRDEILAERCMYAVLAKLCEKADGTSDVDD